MVCKDMYVVRRTMERRGVHNGESLYKAHMRVIYQRRAARVLGFGFKA